MNIGKNILFYRKKEQISQEELADKIGVTRQTISNWELEESYPDLNQATKLAHFFKVNLDDLVNIVSENKTDSTSKNEITIISKIENVIAKSSKIQSSQEFILGKNSPKFALFSVNNDSKIFQNNTFLGWYKNKEDISKEIEEITQAIISKKETYELKYNVEVDKKLLGMHLKIKNNDNINE